MKKILFVLSALLLASCQLVTSPKHVDSDPVPQTYSPPSMGSAKEVNVLRYPSGVVTKSARGLIAQNDPLAAACDDPGTVYMFYDNNALVQYIPFDGGYSSLADSAKLACELNPSWDYISVPPPGLHVNYSHDPVCPVLTIMFLDNDGNLALNINSGQTFTYVCADAAEYQSFIDANGYPGSTLHLTFDTWGAIDGVHIFHILMGGDGLNIAPSHFAEYP
jgi:hypothetical protein